MSVQILTDSTANLSREEAERLGIRIALLTVHFGNRQYIDKSVIIDEELYGVLNTEAEMPTTMQISPRGFLDAYAEYPDNEITGIYISQKLSSTYQSAVIAKEECGRSNVYPVDSTTISVGAILLVCEVVRLHDKGRDGKGIAEYITELTKHMEMLAVFNTMKYLVKGGCLFSTKGTIGNLLGAGPVIRVKDGALEVTRKECGTKKAYDFVVRYLRKLPDLNLSIPITHSYSFNQQDLDTLKWELGEG